MKKLILIFLLIILFFPPKAHAISINDGDLIRAEGTFGVYLVEGDYKRLIRSAEIFIAKGYKWEDIIVVSQTEMNIYPLGSALTMDGEPKDNKILEKKMSSDALSDGMLVRAKNTHGVYLIHNNKKRAIKSATIFLSKGYKWRDVVDIEQEIFFMYPQGSDVVVSGSENTEVNIKQESIGSSQQAQSQNIFREQIKKIYQEYLYKKPEEWEYSAHERRKTPLAIIESWAQGLRNKAQTDEEQKKINALKETVELQDDLIKNQQSQMKNLSSDVKSIEEKLNNLQQKSSDNVVSINNNASSQNTVMSSKLEQCQRIGIGPEKVKAEFQRCVNENEISCHITPWWQNGYSSFPISAETCISLILDIWREENNCDQIGSPRDSCLDGGYNIKDSELEEFYKGKSLPLPAHA